MRYGFIGHNTWVGELGADAIAYPIEGLTLTAGPRLQFGTDDFAETYFGISPVESVASGLDAYDASGGLLATGVESARATSSTSAGASRVRSGRTGS